MHTCDCCRHALHAAGIILDVVVQEAGTSRAGECSLRSRGDTNVERSRPSVAPGPSPIPQLSTARTPQLIALKDGDPIPEGYTYVVDGRADPVPTGRTQVRAGCDTVDLSTPPKATETIAGEGPDSSKNKLNARRNLTRNNNRKANTTFAKELKESLATGQQPTIKLAGDRTDLKATWHAAAKEVAYKFLDLRKESWKDYNIFEKNMVHNEVREQFKSDPPLDSKCIDKYLSGHFRTARAVWKAHWKKFGSMARHHNCPEEAWEKLTKWWQTDACQEEATEMARRRAHVEQNSTAGRISVEERMSVEVSNPTIVYALQCEWASYVLRTAMGGQHAACRTV